jgi:hypothetical protein
MKKPERSGFFSFSYEPGESSLGVEDAAEPEVAHPGVDHLR